MKEAYIYDAVRTPRGKGKPSGALYEVRPIQLLAAVLKALAQRNQLDTSQVEDLLIGCVTPTDDQGANIAKAALLYAGWGHQVSGIQLNRFCTSGLEAVNLAATKVRSGWEDLVVAGGVESMSRVPMISDAGPLMFDPDVINSVGYLPMGVAADLMATLENYSRSDVDVFAFRSQQRALKAQREGYFQKSIIPIHDINGLLILDKDECLYDDCTMEQLSNLPVSFERFGSQGFDSIALKKYARIEQVQHVHTAGNSSGFADGAALVLIGSKEKGDALGLTPRARIVSEGTISTEPTKMLHGAIPAAEKALQRAGLTPNDIDIWEVNEAFSAVALHFQQHFGIADDAFNVNGGSIALGHPLGATGAMLINTLLDELERRDLKRGLVSIPAGAGMGVATIIERL